MSKINNGRYVVLFDLDETIINCKSLFEAYQAYCRQCFSNEAYGVNQYKEVIDELKIMQANGDPREDINARFYSHFKGIPQKRMINIFNEWFIRQRSKNNFFNSSVLEELERHQTHNAEIIIVSGSFLDCVRIVADFLKVKHLVCINLKVRSGVYTGEIEGTQTIGEGKVRAVKQYLYKYNIHGSIKYAYADHPSDTQILQLAKHPVVVGNDEQLLQLASSYNWNVIP